MNWQSAIPPRLGAKVFLAAAVFATAAFAQRPHVPGRLLVGFNSNVSDTSADEVIRGNQGKSHSKIPGTNTHAVDLNGNANEQAVMNALKNRPEVEYVEFDELFPPSDMTPNDTYYATSQKYYPQINAPAGWSIGTGSASVIIAIIDTGVNVNHSDLAGKIVQPHSVLTGGTDVTDNYNHGTMTAGTAAALSNNGTGVAGTCWQCLIMPIKISDGTATTSNIATGLDWARTHGARVANISFEVSTSNTVTKVAQNFAAAGGVTTVSSGNGASFVSSADNPYELTVGAIDSNNVLYAWSNYGNNLDLVAPGCVYTTEAGGSYSSSCGTSFSAPLVAGVAAMVIAANPSLSSTQVMNVLKQSAADLGAAGWDTTYGYGRVDVAGALQAAGGTTNNDTTAPTVSLSSPVNGASITGTITAQASASDNVGVASVAFAVDGVTFCTATVAPYSCGWNSGSVSNGSHVISATARDAAGNSAVSSASVSVSNSTDTSAPVVTLGSLPTGSTVSGIVNLQASATDNVSVSSMALQVDGVTVCTASGASISCNWNSGSTSNGSHTVTATATDPSGNVGSANTSVSVLNAGDTTPPSVAITSPTAGSTVSKNVSVSVSASDNVGVTSVVLLVDGVAIATDTAAPYSFTWKTTGYASGTHTLTAQAKDAAGNVGVSAAVTVMLK